MPIWPLYHIPSIEIHNSNASLSDGSVDSAVGGPFSGEKRGLDLEELARGIGLSHPTTTRLVPADSSRRRDADSPKKIDSN